MGFFNHFDEPPRRRGRERDGVDDRDDLEHRVRRKLGMPKRERDEPCNELGEPRPIIGRNRERDLKRTVDDLYDDDEGFTVDAVEYLLSLLCCMERWRNYLNRDQAAFARLLRDIPGLQQQWATFTGQGGQTAADFNDFLNGEFRPRLIRRKGPLQLVAKKSQPIRSRQQRRQDPQNEGPDAA